MAGGGMNSRQRRTKRLDELLKDLDELLELVGEKVKK